MKRAFILLVVAAFLPWGAAFASSEAAATNNYKKANALFSSAHYKEALPLYQSILSSPSKTSLLVMFTPGSATVITGSVRIRTPSMLMKAQLSTSPAPAQPGTRYWIGFCYFLLRKHDQAVAEFLKIPELYPEAGMWVGTAYYWAGRSCEQLGKKDLALQYYKKAGGNGKSTQGRFAHEEGGGGKRNK